MSEQSPEKYFDSEREIEDCPDLPAWTTNPNDPAMHEWILWHLCFDGKDWKWERTLYENRNQWLPEHWEVPSRGW